jgi:phospholipase/lecithinase/hemolysin
MFIPRCSAAGVWLAAGFLFAALQSCGPLSLTGLDAITTGDGPARLVVFGDSLSDTGNFKRVNPQEWRLAFAEYDDGRFTCGASSRPPSANFRQGVWHEVLMSRPLGVPPLAGSAIYAFGGARTSAGTHHRSYGGLPTGVLIRDLGDQIDRFLVSNGGVAPSENMYVVWAGGNDIFDAIEADWHNLGKDTANAITSASLQAFQNARGEVHRLASAGATRIIWGNLPPLFSTPWATQLSDCADCSQALRNAVASFNHSLEEAIPLLESEFSDQGLKIYELDAERLFADVILDALRNEGRTYGITNFWGQAKHLACDSADVDAYLFWDATHPTSHAHAIIGEAVYRLLMAS